MIDKVKNLIKPSASMILLILMAISSYSSVANQIKGKIHYSIQLNRSDEKDTLFISLADNMVGTLTESAYGDNKRKFRAVKNGNDRFEFDIPVSQKLGYLTIFKNRKLGPVGNVNYVYLLENEYWEDGDSISISLNFKETITGSATDFTFSGRGSEKYDLLNDIYQLKLKQEDIKISDLWPSDWKGNILNLDSFDSLSTPTRAKLSLLEKHRSLLTVDCYNIFKANIIYPNVGGYFSWIENFAYHKGVKSMSLSDQAKFIARFDNAYDYPNNYGIDQKYLLNSTEFMKFLQNKARTASVIANTRYSPEWIYDNMKNSVLSREIKEVLMMREFADSRTFTKNLGYYYNDAKKIIKDPVYLKILKGFELRIPGRKFFDFNLEDVNGKIRKLSDYLNKVVVIDFWYTGCGHCEVYYRNVLSPVEEKLIGNQNVVFISISIDKNKATFISSVKSGVYTSSKSQNLYTNGLSYNHPIIKTNNIPGYPFIILLDRNSKINSFNSANLKDEQSLLNSIKSLL